MNIQDLTNNREAIIATITEQAGAENVKPVMAQMLKGLDCCDTLEELIESAIYMALHFEVKIEKSKLAAMVCANELAENIHYDVAAKEYVKNNY